MMRQRKMIPPSIRVGPYNPNAMGQTEALSVAWNIARTASVAASAYHGYKRNQSVGWALVWGFFGGLAPVVTPAIALAQGFGKRKPGR